MISQCKHGHNILQLSASCAFLHAEHAELFNQKVKFSIKILAHEHAWHDDAFAWLQPLLQWSLGSLGVIFSLALRILLCLICQCLQSFALVFSFDSVGTPEECFLQFFAFWSLNLYFPTRSSSTALRSAHLLSSSWWCVVGVATYPTDPPSRDFTKPWGPMSTSEPRLLGSTTRRVSPSLDSFKTTDWHDRTEDWDCVQEKASVRGNGRTVVRRWVCFVVTAALCSERQHGGRRQGGSAQRRSKPFSHWWTKISKLFTDFYHYWFHSFVHIFNAPLTKTSRRTFWHIFSSCCYGAKGAVNFIFFFSLAF